MISNFPKPKGYNLGGLRSFLYAHVHSFLSFPAIKDGVITAPVQFVAGAGWFTGYSTLYTLNFDENGKDSPNGPIYDQVLSGFSPGDRPENLDAIHSAEGAEFVLLVTDANGQKRLIGGYGYPLTFLADYSSGSNRSDTKGYAYKFFGNSTFRAPIYKA